MLSRKQIKNIGIYNIWIELSFVSLNFDRSNGYEVVRHAVSTKILTSNLIILQDTYFHITSH